MRGDGTHKGMARTGQGVIAERIKYKPQYEAGIAMCKAIRTRSKKYAANK